MQRALLLLSTTLLFAFANTAQAQRSKMILGEWIYSEAISTEKLDAEAQKMMDAFLSSMWFSFKADGTYSNALFDKEESGTWKMDADGKVITLTPTQGQATELLVKDLSATTWIMEIEPGKGFKMVHGARKKE